MTISTQDAPLIPFDDLLALYSERYPKDWVDADMRGKPINSAMVLLGGAYGPATRRLLAQVALEAVPVTQERLLDLAPEAFAAKEDRDLTGNIITSYAVVLAKPHGFGQMLLNLARLVPEVQAGVRAAAG